MTPKALRVYFAFFFGIDRLPRMWARYWYIAGIRSLSVVGRKRLRLHRARKHRLRSTARELTKVISN